MKKIVRAAIAAAAGALMIGGGMLVPAANAATELTAEDPCGTANDVVVLPGKWAGDLIDYYEIDGQKFTVDYSDTKLPAPEGSAIRTIIDANQGNLTGKAYGVYGAISEFSAHVTLTNVACEEPTPTVDPEPGCTLKTAADLGWTEIPAIYFGKDVNSARVRTANGTEFTITPGMPVEPTDVIVFLTLADDTKISGCDLEAAPVVPDPEPIPDCLGTAGELGWTEVPAIYLGKDVHSARILNAAGTEATMTTGMPLEPTDVIVYLEFADGTRIEGCQIPGEETPGWAVPTDYPTTDPLPSFDPSQIPSDTPTPTPVPGKPGVPSTGADGVASALGVIALGAAIAGTGLVYRARKNK